MPQSSRAITVTINGTEYEREVEARKLLIHFIRDDLDLTGSHIGCDTGNCGACSRDRRRRAGEELHDARRPGRRLVDRDGRGPGRVRRADAAAAVVQRPSRAPVRLLHAGDADERDRAAAREPEPVRGRGQEGAAGQHLPLHRLLEHHRGRAGGRRSEHTPSSRRRRSRRRRRAGPARASRARRTSGSSRARASSSTTSSGTGWATSSSSARRTRTRTSPRSTSRKAESIKGVYGTLTGEEVAALTDPFFQLSTPPGAHLKDFALAVGKVRYVGEAVVAVVAETRELARDASELVEVEYEPLDAVTDARHAQDDGAPVLHDDSGSNLMWEGVYEWGDLDAAFAEADKVVKISELHFHRFNSTPLETDGALVEFNRGTGQWTIYTNNQFPGFAAIMMGPAMRTRPRQAALRHAGHRRRLRQQDHVAPAARRLLPARAEAQPRRAVDGVAHRLPHVDVARQRALVPRHRGRGEERRHAARLPDEGARRRGRVAALRAARRRDLGAGDARACTAGATSGSSSRRWRRTRRPSRRTAATRACSTSGSPSA